MNVVRVLHFSDIHFVPIPRPGQTAVNQPGRAAANQPGPSLRARLSAALAKGLKQIPKFAQGMSPHEPLALRWLSRSIQDHVSKHPWPDEVELVCTGDLTTWGDDISLAGARKFVEQLASVLQVPHRILYGNHDVWPGSIGILPFLQNRNNLGTRRSAMRAAYFAGQSWLDPFLKKSVGGYRVGLCAINTVQHEPFQNMFALGKVQADRYWEPLPVPSSQLAELETFLAATNVALVFSHHPIEPFGHVTNASKVAGKLMAGAHHDVRLVLSGHTHEYEPKRLPPSFAQGALQRNVGQLTIGTCAQKAFNRRKLTRSWQALDLSIERDHLHVDRTVYVQNNAGPFVPRRDAIDLPLL